MRMRPSAIGIAAALLMSVACAGHLQRTPVTIPAMTGFPRSGSQVALSEEAVQLGRRLFYDPILSIDTTVSCATCHRQEAAFSDAPIRFSAGVGHPMARNTPPLFNLAWHPSMFWDGRAGSIEAQAFHPVREQDEMGLDWQAATARLSAHPYYRKAFRQVFGKGGIDSTDVSIAIGQFLRTLVSASSKYDRVLRGEEYLNESEYKGFELVNDMTMGDCLHCHTTDSDALGSTFAFSNNGLDPVTDPMQFSDPGRGAITGRLEDRGKFKVPSLRNLLFTPPYMHDGRFATLEEVLEFYSRGVHASANIDSKMGSAHRGGVGLTCEEQEHIIAFLHTLTDSAFVIDGAFTDPFVTVRHEALPN